MNRQELPTTRREAMSVGSLRYFTGSPCKYGHTSERQTSDGACITCRDKKVKAWAEKNKEKCLASHRAWNERNKSTLQIKAAQKYAENPNKYRAQALDSYYRHRKNRIEGAKAWKLSNIDRVKAYATEYASKHKAERATAQRNRHYKKRTSGTHTVQDVFVLLKLQRHKCATCAASVKKKFHVDHIVPLFLNGSNSKENLQILCPSCNLSKSKKDPIAWANQNGKLL